MTWRWNTKLYQWMYSVSKTYIYHERIYPMKRSWKERLGHVFVSQDAFHPAARRAYEEHGVTYGSEGVQQWIAEQGG